MRNRTIEIVTIRENIAVYTGFCILIALTVSIAACTIPASGTNNPVTTPAQPDPTSSVPVSITTEPAITQIQVVQPADTDNRTQILNQQPEGPVSLTINSARKQLGLGVWGDEYSEPIPGNVYLVLNITVKNNDVKEGFNFSRSSLVVRDLDSDTRNRAMYVRESLRKYLENPLVLPVTLQQNDIVTGQVLFETNDSMNYNVNLIDDNKNLIAFQPVSFENLFTTENPVSITIHSARKVPNFTTSMPMPGHIFLILNVTIKNNDIREGFGFDFTSTQMYGLRNGEYERQSLNNGVNLIKNLENPIIVPTTIKQNGTKTGQLIFGIADSTEYRLNLIDNNKTIIASRNVDV